MAEKTFVPRALREYVRLTFTPAGASRTRTVWAQRLSEGKLGDGTVTVRYLQVTPDGDNFSGGTKDGVPVEQHRVILATKSEVAEKRAVMSLHYGELVAEGSAEWEVEMATYAEVQAKHAAERQKIRDAKK